MYLKRSSTICVTCDSVVNSIKSFSAVIIVMINSTCMTARHLNEKMNHKVNMNKNVDKISSKLLDLSRG